VSLRLGHLLPGNLAGRQGQVHNLGRNARTGSDQCHPEMCASQGLFSPDSLFASGSCTWHSRLPVHFSGRFSEPKSIPPQVSRPYGLTGRVSAAHAMQREGRGCKTTCWSSTDSLPFLCVWPEISFSITCISPSPVINHKLPRGG